jgi:hypothetical protein
VGPTGSCLCWAFDFGFSFSSRNDAPSKKPWFLIEPKGPRSCGLWHVACPELKRAGRTDLARPTPLIRRAFALDPPPPPPRPPAPPARPRPEIPDSGGPSPNPTSAPPPLPSSPLGAPPSLAPPRAIAPLYPRPLTPKGRHRPRPRPRPPPGHRRSACAPPLPLPLPCKKSLKYSPAL